MTEVTTKKLAARQAIKLYWLANSGADCSIIISNPGNGKVLFTDSQDGENVESFDENDFEGIDKAIGKYENEGYILQN